MTIKTSSPELQQSAQPDLKATVCQLMIQATLEETFGAEGAYAPSE